MRSVLLYVLPFMVSLSTASWNDSRPFPFSATSPTSNFSSLEVAPFCQANCVVHFDTPLSYSWKSFIINTTVTAARATVTVYPKFNVTTTGFDLDYLALSAAGYKAQDITEGIVSTTLTYGRSTNARGREVAITEVITYPSLPTASPALYWWSGVRPTAATGSSSCITQLDRTTVQLPAHPTIAQPTRAAKNSSSDGRNHYLVAHPDPNAIQAMHSYEGILAECRHPSATFQAYIDEPMTTASFITITDTKTKTITNCHPEMMCNVREEKTETGGLIGPSGRPLPPVGAAGVEGIMQAQTVHGEKSATAKAEKSATALAGVGAPASPRVHPEKPVTSVVVPARGPQPAGLNNFPVPGLSPGSPQPMVTNAPPALGTLVLGSATVAVSIVPAAPIAVGPHNESPPLVAIGGKTMTMGVTATFADQIVAIKTVAGGAAVAVLGNTRNGKIQTFALNDGIIANGGGSANAAGFGGGGDYADLGGIFAPTPVALPQQQSRPRVIVGDNTLTPSNNGGFSVAGTSLVLGGAPITLYGSTGAAENAGSGSPGNKISATVLSLTTNASGAEVLVVNGKTSILPTGGPLETGNPNLAQYGGTSSDLASNTNPGSTRAGAIAASASHKNVASRFVTGSNDIWRCATAFSIVAMISW